MREGDKRRASGIGEKFYDKKVTDEESALAAVKSAYGRIGADDTTDLQVTAIRPTETGTTYCLKLGQSLSRAIVLVGVSLREGVGLALSGYEC